MWDSYATRGRNEDLISAGFSRSSSPYKFKMRAAEVGCRKSIRDISAIAALLSSRHSSDIFGSSGLDCALTLSERFFPLRRRAFSEACRESSKVSCIKYARSGFGTPRYTCSRGFGTVPYHSGPSVGNGPAKYTLRCRLSIKTDSINNIRKFM